MKRKIFYFIISCIFAVITSANTTSQTADIIFRAETEQSSILNNENEKKTKDYTSITLDKVQLVKKAVLKNNFEEYTLIDFEDIEVEKNSIENDRLIEKNVGTPPSYTILYRYKTRVLRI